MLHLSGCMLLPHFPYQGGSWTWGYLWWQEGGSSWDGSHVLAVAHHGDMETGHLFPGYLNLLTIVGA